MAIESVLGVVLSLRERTSYLNYCSKKLTKLRKSAKDENEKSPDDTDSWIAIYESERAWAHSQSLQPGKDGNNARRKHHLSRRLARSVEHAQTCYKLQSTNSSATTHSTINCAAYLLFRKGEWYRSKSDWKAGLEAFALARQALALLLEKALLPADILAITHWLADTDTYFRQCAHNLGINQDLDSLTKTTIAQLDNQPSDIAPKGYHGLVSEYKNTLSNSQETLDKSSVSLELTFQNQTITINDPSLVDLVNSARPFLDIIDSSFYSKPAGMIPRSFLLNSLRQTRASNQKMSPSNKTNNNKTDSSSTTNNNNQKKNQANDGKISINKLQAFDRVLAILADAQDRANEAVTANTTAMNRTFAERFRKSQAPLQYAHDYIAYQHIRVRIMRDHALAHDILSRLSKKQERQNKAQYSNQLKPRHMNKPSHQQITTSDRRRVRLYATVIKLFDNTLQNLEILAQLKIVEDDSDLTFLIETNLYAVKAKRVAVLSSLYHLTKHYAESAALATQQQLYLRQAQQAISQLPEIQSTSPSSLLPLSLQNIATDMDRAIAEYRHIAVDWHDSMTVAANKPDNDDEQHVAADDDETILKKPVFFDVAFNFAAALSADEILQRAGKTSPAAVPTKKEQATQKTRAVSAKKNVDQEQEQDSQEQLDNQTDQSGQRRGRFWSYLGL